MEITPSRLKDFQLISYDILKLLAHKSKSNETVQKREFEIIEAFYDQCHSIVTNSTLDTQAARLAATNEHFKAVCLSEELKVVYNEVYQKDASLALDLIKQSHVPTKKDLDSNLAFK